MNITEEGRAALSNVLFNTDGVDTVAKSNHTCFVQTVSGGDESTPHETLLDILNRNSCPKDNCKWKVLSVLYTTNGKGGKHEFETYRSLKLIPEIFAYIGDSSGDTFDDEVEMAQPTAEESCEILQVVDDDLSIESDGVSHVMSIESDDSYDGYDSLMEEIDEAFEDDETDKALDESFMNRARLTMAYQVLKLWGLPLLDKGPPLPEPVIDTAKKGKKPRRRQIVISQRELKSLLS